MAPEKKNIFELLNGIEKDATLEREKILEEVKIYVEEKKSSTDTQIEFIIQEASAKAISQSNTIKKEVLGRISVEEKRIQLKVRDQIIQNMLEFSKEKLLHCIAKPGYIDILKGWIVEGALGLNKKTAYVNASNKEKHLIDIKLLKEAEKIIESKIGYSVKLILTDEPPLIEQGVVLYSEDKKTAYNNQVITRFQRFQTQIRRVIYQNLFEDEKEL